MKENFELVMDELFRHEGGYVNHKSDPGGETKYGISKRSYPNVDIRALTKEQARAIYRRDYWAKIKGDELPAGIDLVTMDPAVNSGVARGVKWLQGAIGFSGVDVDGKVGPKTLKRANSVNTVNAIKSACAARMSFLRGLKTWTTFGKGWTRRVAEVEAAGVSMAVLDQTRSVDEAHKALVVGGEDAARKSQTAGSAAAGSGGAAAAGGAGQISPELTGVDIPVLSQLDPQTAIIGVLLLAIAGLLYASRSRQQAIRAEAYLCQHDRLNDMKEEGLLCA